MNVNKRLMPHSIPREITSSVPQFRQLWHEAASLRPGSFGLADFTAINSFSPRKRAWQELVAILVMLVFLFSACWATVPVADFLNIPSDPKSVACGETIMSFTDTPAAILSNPCALLNLHQAKLSFHEVLMWEDMKYHFIGFGLPSKYGNIGLGISFLDYGGIDGLQADGITPVALSSIYDMIATLNYSLPIKSDIPITRDFGGVGMSIKLIQSRVDKYKADAVAMDFGATYKLPLPESIYAGVVYKNTGASLKFYGESEPVSQTFGAGLKWNKPQWSNLFVLWDMQKNADIPGTAYSYGAGFNPFYGISLWGGWKDLGGTLNTGLRLGFGIDLDNYRLNYALAPMKEFGTQHYFSIDIPLMNIADKEVAYDYYVKMHFQEAQNKYYQGDYVASRQILEEILGVYPNHKQAKKYLGKINEELDRIESRKKVLIRTFLTKGQISLEKGEYEKARSYFANVLKIDASNNEAIEGYNNTDNLIERSKFVKLRRKLEAMAIYYYSHRDYVNSKETFRKILKGDPDDVDAKLFIDEIDAKLARMSNVDINDYFFKGSQYFKKGDYQHALKYFDAVLIATPNRYDVQDLVNKSEEYIQLKELRGRNNDPVREKIKTEAELKSKFLRALGYYEDGKYNLALITFNEAKDIENALGLNKYMGKIDKYTAKIVEILCDQNLKVAFNAKDKGDYEKAIEAYKSVLVYNPNHVLALEEIKVIGLEQAKIFFESGMNYYTSGELEKAREAFGKALFFNPDYEEAKRALEKLQ